MVFSDTSNIRLRHFRGAKRPRQHGMFNLVRIFAKRETTDHLKPFFALFAGCREMPVLVRGAATFRADLWAEPRTRQWSGLRFPSLGAFDDM